MTLNISKISRYYIVIYNYVLWFSIILLYKVFYCSGGRDCDKINFNKTIWQIVFFHTGGLKASEIPGEAGGGLV